MREFVYERNGSLFSPTTWAGSPWAEGLQHGGPINALFALAAEEAAQASDLHVVRMTVDLIRPVPRIPLALSWHFTRQGRRLANVEAQLNHPKTEELISRAQIALLRPQEQASPTIQTAPPDLASLKAFPAIEFIPKAVRSHVPPGFHMSFAVRLGQDDAGPAAWITSPLDLLPGTPMSPLQRSAAVADLTFALCQQTLRQAQSNPDNEWGPPSINVDTTLYWERAPVGDWFGFRPGLVTAQKGIGVIDASMGDVQGRLGRSVQATLIQEAEPPSDRS